MTATIAETVFDLYKVLERYNLLIPKRIIGLIQEKLIHHTEGLSQANDSLEYLISGEILILSGDPGCGKTVASIYAGLNFSARTQTMFYFMTSREYLKCQFNGGTVIINGIELQPEGIEALLIVDDLGREYFKDTGWGIDQWDSFFDKRYRDKLPTIITTNMTPEELVDKYNERILDRLRECGIWIGLSGKSQRKKKES